MKKPTKYKKNIKQSLRNKILNLRRKSAIKICLKKLRDKISNKTSSESLVPVSLVEVLSTSKKIESLLDKSIKHNIFSKNYVARKKAQIHSKIYHKHCF